MKRFFFSAVLLAAGTFSASAQEGNIKFTEYDLPNGLHVILHEDHTVPIVSVSVMYHVGSKNEDPSRTGFAHFFEHLLFEGSENIQRGEYSKLVQNNGGVLNANTSQDRTYYFEVLPSNQLELGLWMESERMLHAKIDSTGIETQRKVVKEEKKMRYDNSPYGMWQSLIFENAYTKHPYRWTPIGKEQYIDQAKASEFMDFYKTFYVPNNAVLVIAGDIKPEQAKEWIGKYFSDIPKGTGTIPRPTAVEPQQTKEKRVRYNANVQLPMVVLAYHAPKMGTDDMYALELLNQLLSQGASSRLQKQVVDKDHKAVQVAAFNFPLEDPGLVITLGIAAQGVDASDLEKAMKNEIDKVRENLISEAEFKKLQNQAENGFVSQNARISGIAESLATNYTYFHDANLINTELGRYQKITREDLKRVAGKYLTKDNCVVLQYVPKGQ
ncbi:M16 family metallopeptidase [Taibaiella koreensis]|uniref:M16 family metallopeptidase n=1 Tax=Taibaiella koreensis TaxID=1268548 RepID=UPI000E59CE5C|nr:pitrilysin family protein [Taibaiella koreensis]